MPFNYRLLLVFVFGFIGGAGFYVAGAPMPFLLGGIVGAAGFVLTYERQGRELPKLTPWVRMAFAAVIGAMIGSRFTPELLTLLPQFWVSLFFILGFILVAHAGNFFLMYKLAGYKKLDAYFAALPGGIVDSIALAEQAKADVRIVTVQHFIRIIFVVSTVPVLFWIIDGNAVGSVAGESFANAIYSRSDVIIVLALAAAGLFMGRFIKLPVAHLMGPLLLALVLSVVGIVEVAIPPWLQHLAQYMIGVSLGAQFSGVSRRLLLRGLSVGFMSGCFMLALAAGIAMILTNLVPAGFGALFISFAAGGLAEMSLIALTLNFNPVVVALHHLARIFLTVWVGSFLSVRVFKLVKRP